VTSYNSFSAEETMAIAADFARAAKPGDIICLSGPLGAGKTVFAQGFAKEIGCIGHVTSPTFTILQVYEGGRLPIYHFDLYRLEGGLDELEGIGYEDYFYADGVCLIEWPSMIPEAMPPTAIWLEMSIDFTNDAESRKIRRLDFFGNSK